MNFVELGGHKELGQVTHRLSYLFPIAKARGQAEVEIANPGAPGHCAMAEGHLKSEYK
jgi:hypothetical protein